MWRRRSTVIDEEAERPRTRSRAKLEVKRARNAQNSISISLLPPEILLLIFLAVKDAHSGDQGTGSLRHMDWVRVTHVCHHWRVVALKAPTLWATLSITSSSSHRYWARLAIERSKQSLLSAYVECFDSGNDRWSEGSNTISLLANNLLRCHSLTLRITNKICTLNSLFEHYHAPNLHSLAILFPYDRTASFKFSDKTLSAPSLKHLRLSNCCVDWNSTFFQSITYLEINRMVHGRLYLPEFISVLSYMSSLKELNTDVTPFYLVSPDEPVDAPSIHTFPKITTLTNVDKITLIGTMAATTAFFSSFRSLPNAHISAIAASRRSPLQFFLGFDRLLDALAYHFPSTANCTAQGDTESLPFRSLKIRHKNKRFSIQAYHSTRHLLDLASCDLQLIALNILIPTEDFTSLFEPQLMRFIFTGLPFDDLVSANVVGEFTFDATVWADTFGRIAGLQSIVLTSVNMAFFDGLVHRFQESNTEVSHADEKTRSRIPFPSLDTVLVFSAVELKSSIIEAIDSVLKRREEIGKPVFNVVLLAPGRDKSASQVVLRSTIPEEELKRDMIEALRKNLLNTEK